MNFQLSSRTNGTGFTYLNAFKQIHAKSANDFNDLILREKKTIEKCVAVEADKKDGLAQRYVKSHGRFYDYQCYKTGKPSILWQKQQSTSIHV